MKKGIVFVFAVLFVLGGVVSAFAQTAVTIADTTHKGSILIYPKIDVSYGKDTFVWLSNDGPSPVNVDCYWVTGSDWVGGPSDPANAQIPFSFLISLSAFQEFNFSSAYGGETLVTTASPFPGPQYETYKGYLACVAVISENVTVPQPANYNYLYGKAWVVDYTNNVAYSYPAWSFRALNAVTGTAPVAIPSIASGSPGILPGNPNGTPTPGLKLPLDGATYSACPGQLVFDFPLEGYLPQWFPYSGTNDVTLMPCIQDLRQDRVLTHTKFQFEVYNTFETGFDGAFGCSNCWFDHFLNDYNQAAVLTYFGPNGAFSAANALGTFPFTDSTETSFAGGRFRVNSVVSSDCNFPATNPAVSTGLIGVLTSYVPAWWGGSLTAGSKSAPVFAFTSNGAAGSYYAPAGYLEIDQSPASTSNPGAKKGKK